jgi:hypothetical protein
MTVSFSMKDDWRLMHSMPSIYYGPFMMAGPSHKSADSDERDGTFRAIYFHRFLLDSHKSSSKSLLIRTRSAGAVQIDLNVHPAKRIPVVVVVNFQETLQNKNGPSLSSLCRTKSLIPPSQQLVFSLQTINT